MRTINRKPIVAWHVESHRVEGVGLGPETGEYTTSDAAVAAMIAAKAAGRDATCIARNALGEGRLLVLGLVPAL